MKNLRNLIENIKSKDSSSNTPNETKSKNPKLMQKQQSLNPVKTPTIIKTHRQGDSFSEYGSASRKNQGSVLSKRQQSPIDSQNSIQNGQNQKMKTLMSPTKSKSIMILNSSGTKEKNQPLQIQKIKSQQVQSSIGTNKPDRRNQSGPPKNLQTNLKNLHLKKPQPNQSSVIGQTERNNRNIATKNQASSLNLRQTHLNQGTDDDYEDQIFKNWVMKKQQWTGGKQSSPGQPFQQVQAVQQQHQIPQKYIQKPLVQKKLDFTENNKAMRSQSPVQEQPKYTISKGSKSTRSLKSQENIEVASIKVDQLDSQFLPDENIDNTIKDTKIDKPVLQRSSGKPTLKEQIMQQTSESNKSLIEFMNSDILKATVDPAIELSKFNLSDQIQAKELKTLDQQDQEFINYQNNNYNNINIQQNGASAHPEVIIQEEPAVIEDLQVQAQEVLITEHPQVDVRMEPDGSNTDTNLNNQILDSKIQNFKEDCGYSNQETSKPEKELSDQTPPFYVIEQQDMLKNTQLMKKRLFIQQPPFNLKIHNIQSQWKVLSRFIVVSKVVLNQMAAFLEQFRDAFVQAITFNKEQRLAVHLDIYFEKMKSRDFENDAVLTQQILALANETKNIFLEVYESYLSGENSKLNLTSMKHCIKRIFKASQIQLDDFQWKNGPYRESQFTTAQQPKEDENVDDELFLSTVKQRTKVLSDVIEIEQVSKLYLELFKKNFFQIYEQSLHTVLNLVIFNNEHIQAQTSCFQSKDSQFDFYNRVRAYFQRFNQFSNFNTPPIVLNSEITNSIVHQFFDSNHMQSVQQENLLMISLMELGNTIDGVAIAAKILKDIEDNYEEKKNFYVNFQTFQQSFKKRKCHCCMEFILDAGKAVTCANLIKSYNPCLNLYCQNCVVAFMEEKHNFEDDDVDKLRSGEKTPPQKEAPKEEKLESAEKQQQKEKEERILKHKLWLKACENVLFVCPCCQGYCLNEKLSDMKKEFSHFSVCNFNYKLEHHPRSFLRRDVYWYKVQGIYKMFQLAKIVGLNKQKQMHKIEVIQNSQTYQLRLSREEIFFLSTVKKGTKMFDIIDKQGPELDIQAQINKQIKDFKKFETQDIFDRFINHVDKIDREKSKFAIQNGFIVPKFQYLNATQTSRGEFLQCHRTLHKRYDHQIYESFQDFMIDILCSSDPLVDIPLMQPLKIQIKGKQEIQSSPARAQEIDQEMTPVSPTPKEIEKPQSPEQLSEKHDKLPIRGTGSDDQLLMKIGKTCVLVDRNDKEKIESLKRQARNPEILPQSSSPKPMQELETRRKIPINYKLFNEKGRAQSLSPQLTQVIEPEPVIVPKQWQQSHIKFSPAEISIGQQMILEKNYQLAKDQGGEHVSLLITKEVFIVEKVHQSKIDTSLMIDALKLIELTISEESEVIPLEQTIQVYELRDVEFNGVQDCSMPYIQSGQISPEQDWVSNIIPYADLQKKMKEVYEQQQKAIIEYKKQQEYKKLQEKKEKKEKKELSQQQSSEQQIQQDPPKKASEELNNYKYSFKDFEPKQYNLRRGAGEKQIIPGVGKKLVFQPSVKQHVEEGFFDDWPQDIIKEFKLRVTKKPRNSRTAKEISAPPEAEPQLIVPSTPPSAEFKLFKRKFILTPKLQEDCDQSKFAAENLPEELSSLFIYIYREETKVWRRAMVNNHLEALTFNVEYQDSKKSVRKVDLGKFLFFVDQENEVQRQVDKLLSYPLFNNKNRVKKLLSQVHLKIQEKKEEPAKKRQKIQENGIIKEVKQKVEQVPIVEKILSLSLPPAFLQSQNLLLGEHDLSEVILLSSASADAVDADAENPESIKDLSFKEEDEHSVEKPVIPGDPNESWTKDMKLYIICKSKEQIKNHKVLKFYHQQIEENEETLSCDFEEPEDEQRVKITALIEQIKTQTIFYQQPFDQQSFLLNKLEYENQMIQQEKMDYLKKIEQSVEPKMFQQPTQELQMRQLKFLQILRLHQMKQIQEQIVQLPPQPPQVPVPEQQSETQCYNVTQEDDFVEILASFVKYKAVEGSEVSDANSKIQVVQDMIDQIDAMGELWPDAGQNLPEELEISKVYENLQGAKPYNPAQILEQAVECLDEAFKNEKQLENDLVDFMHIYKKPENDVSQSVSEQNQSQIQSNESTQFPLNIQKEQSADKQNHSEFFNMISGLEPPQIQKTKNEQPEINPYQYIKNINKKPLENSKYPKLVDQIAALFNIKNPFIKAKRLQYFMHKFYTTQILTNGYKKCCCDICIQLEYPMLIRFDLNCEQFITQHRWQIQQIQQSDESFLRTIFSQPKSNKTMEDEAYVSRMAKGMHQPIFDILVKGQQEAFKVPLQKKHGILPKISQVYTLDGDEQQSKLEAKIQTMLSRQVHTQDDESYNSQKYIKDTQNLQMEFFQLREMQKLLNDMKMAKIEKHRKNKKKLANKNQQNNQREQLMKNQSFLNQVFEDIFTDHQQMQFEPMNYQYDNGYQYPDEYMQQPNEDMYYEEVPPQFQFGPMQQQTQKLKNDESLKSDVMTLLHNPVISKMPVLDK